MKDVNKVILVGRLGADPLIRSTKSGTRVAHFSVATTRRFVREATDGVDPVYDEDTQWHQIVVWGKLGENCHQYLKKGSPVYLEGSIKSNRYENKAGNPKLSFEIHAEEVCFLGAPTKKPTQAESPPPTDCTIEPIAGESQL